MTHPSRLARGRGGGLVKFRGLFLSAPPPAPCPRILSPYPGSKIERERSFIHVDQNVHLRLIPQSPETRFGPRFSRRASKSCRCKTEEIRSL